RCVRDGFGRRCSPGGDPRPTRETRRCLLSAKATSAPRWRNWLAILALRPVPFWTSNRWRCAGRWLALLAYAYFGVLVVLLCLENWLLFPGARFDSRGVDPPGWLKATQVYFATEDGTRIHGWWALPDGWTPGQGALLYCHGTGTNLSKRP